MKQQFPHFTFGEVGKHLGQLWSQLSAEEKEEWSVHDTPADTRVCSRTQKAAQWTPSKPKKARTPSRKSKAQKVTKDDDATSSESKEDTEEDEEEADPEWAAVQKKMSNIIDNGNLDTLSIKTIKEQLAQSFGLDYVTNRGSQIKEFITRRISEA